MRLTVPRWGFLHPFPGAGKSRRVGSHFCTRPFSAAPDARVESFIIKTGSAGHITVDLYNSQALSSSNIPLVVYLPPTGVHQSSHHPPIPSVLHSSSQQEFSVAQINYRWDHNPAPIPHIDDPSPPPPPLLSSSPSFNNHPFPTPLHDTLHAFSWLTEEYLPSLTTSDPASTLNCYPSPPLSPYSSRTITNKSRPLLIYGSYLGGTLATSLALTESRSSKLSSVNIHGLIVVNGIFNWTSIATTKDISTPSPLATGLEDHISSSTPFTLPDLHPLKHDLFAQPSSCFDPFASPALFFRSAGVSIPALFPGTQPAIPTADISGLSLSDPERADLLAMLGAEDSPTNNSSTHSKEEEPEITRRSYLKFPPSASGLRIPRSLFLYTASPSGDEETKDQTVEMARLMRRSVVMYEYKERVQWNENLDPHAASEERVKVEKVGVGAGEMGAVMEKWIEELD